MVGNYEVVTLCGSTKFKEDFLKAQDIKLSMSKTQVLGDTKIGVWKS